MKGKKSDLETAQRNPMKGKKSDLETVSRMLKDLCVPTYLIISAFLIVVLFISTNNCLCRMMIIPILGLWTA
jgi:hypothetical protein